MSSTITSRRNTVINEIIPTVDMRPFINGEYVDSRSDTSFDSLDPMTQMRVATLPEADTQDVSNAVTAARKAFDEGPWPRMHPRERARYILKLADLIEDHLDALALLESVDAGKRLVGLRGWDIPNAAEVYRYYAGWADKIAGHVAASPTGFEMTTRKEPVGVAAALVPWNFPFPGIAWKVGPALAAGCTTILKSPERAPLTGQFLGALIQQADFPPGVLNIVAGHGRTTGRALVADTRVDKISFTGSTATAQDIVKNSMHYMPSLTFELGDKTPSVIFPDADLDAAVASAASFMFGNGAGQDCVAASRVLVHSSIYDDVLSRLLEITKTRRLGDQLDDETQQGPQIDIAHVEHIERCVQTAISNGASVAIGGEVRGDHGQFYAPTILVNTVTSMPINQEEVFGPVSTILPFSTAEEAVQMANDRSFGLAAAIWTSDWRLAEQFTSRVRAGSVWVNCYEYLDTVLPWGGRGLSGTGRELGYEGIEQYLFTKAVVRAY